MNDIAKEERDLMKRLEELARIEGERESKMKITNLRELECYAERQNKVEMIRSLCPYLTSHPLKVPGDCEAKSYEKGYWAAVNDIVKKLNSLARES